jgi:CoA:oxalate CoA-transferase
MIADHVATRPTAHWLGRMQPVDIWCAEVLDWPDLLQGEAFRRLDMLQTVVSLNGHSVRTTRSPIRIDGMRRECRDAAPRIGEHTEALRAEMGL